MQEKCSKLSLFCRVCIEESTELDDANDDLHLVTHLYVQVIPSYKRITMRIY